jgi:hypothetical protein
MSLKKATVTFTKENGEQVSRVLTIKSVVFHYEEAAVETIYRVHPSESARLRGATPEYISQRAPVDLTNMEDLQMVFAVSSLLWEKNADSPFISDYSEVDEHGRQQHILKSLNDLGATIADA